MVIIRIKGGLGNQLFQYAAGYAMAQRLNQPLALDISFFSKQSLRGYKLTHLNIENQDVYQYQGIRLISLINNRCINKLLRSFNIQKIPIGMNKIYLLETKPNIVKMFFTVNSEDIYLDGYWQSEEYFKQFRNSFLHQFKPVYEMNYQTKKIMTQIQNTNSVAVHVRRGDMLKLKNDFNPGHYVLDNKYYDEAMTYVEQRVDNPVYYWFSDDINWVKEQYGKNENFQYVSLQTSNADIDELMLMRSCKHIIAANSTFSWWAAWLNENKNAIKIIPKQRYGNIKMIPEDWVRI